MVLVQEDILLHFARIQHTMQAHQELVGEVVEEVEVEEVLVLEEDLDIYMILPDRIVQLDHN